MQSKPKKKENANASANSLKKNRKVLFISDEDMSFKNSDIISKDKSPQIDFTYCSVESSEKFKDYSFDFVVFRSGSSLPLIVKSLKKINTAFADIPCLIISDHTQALRQKKQFSNERAFLLPYKGIDTDAILFLASEIIERGISITADSSIKKQKQAGDKAKSIERSLSDVTEPEILRLSKYERAVMECTNVLSLTEDIYSALQTVLEKLISAADVSRAYLFQYSFDNKKRLYAKKIGWAVNQNAKFIQDREEHINLIYEKMPQSIYNALSSKKEYLKTQSDFTPDEAAFCAKLSVKSFFLIPLIVKNNLWGFVGFDDCLDERVWKKEEIFSLKTVARIVGYFFEREFTLEALRKSEQKYKVVAETSITGIGIVNEYETFTWVNKAFADMLGYTVEEMIGKNLAQMSPLSEFKKYQQKTVEKKKGKRNGYESRLYHKTGRSVDIYVNSSPLTKADGSFEGALAVVVDITASKHSMEMLARSEKKYKELIQHLSEGIFLINKEGKIIFTNQALSEMLDYDDDELIGKNVSDLVNEDYRYVINKLLLSSKSSAVRNLEIELKGKYGEMIYAYFAVSRMEIEDDDQMAFLISVVDITSLKKAESELKKLDFQLQERVKELHGLFLLEDLNRKTEDVEVFFQTFVEKIVPSSLSFPKEMVVSVRIDDKEFHNKTAVDVKNTVNEPIIINERKAGLLSVGYISDSYGISDYESQLIRQFAERIGTIMESRMIEEALKLKSSAIETSISAFIFLDMKGKLTYVNKAFLNLWGFESQSEVYGRPVHHFFGLRIPYDDIFKRMKKDGFWQGELTAMKKEGAFFSVHVSANLMMGSDGKPQSIMASFIDISELKMLQERLIQSERLAATGQLVAAIAHEINSPLQAITFLLNSLSNKCAFDTAVKNDVELLKDAFGRIRDTVKDLLFLNKPGKEKRQITNINRIIEGTVNISSKYLRGRKIKINCDLSKDLPDIIASPQQLGQLILNLLNNSVEAITGTAGKRNYRDGNSSIGEISIKTSFDNNEIIIFFEDDGPGIDPEDINYIFDPFFTKKKKMGMGVGLSICYNVVKEHKGNITVSNLKNGGALFMIKIPLEGNEV